MLVFSYMYINTVYILYYHSNVWLHLEEHFLHFLKMAVRKVCEQYHNMASFPIWLQIQIGRMLLFLDRLQVFCEHLYFRFFK